MKQIIAVPPIQAVETVEEIALSMNASTAEILEAHRLGRILEVPVVFILDAQ